MTNRGLSGTTADPSVDIVTVQGNASGVPLPTTAAITPVVATTATLANTAASASSVALVALNTNRLGLQIFNDSASALYLKYGTTASLTSFTVKVPAFSLWEMPATPRYTGRIDAIWDSATGNARATELTA